MTIQKLPAGCGETGRVDDPGAARLVQAPAGGTAPAGDRAPTPARQWTIPLPYIDPPLSLNQRIHWQTKARITKDLKDAVHVLMLGSHVPRMTRCRVELHFIPPDRRRRDRDNLVATHKPCCDGIVRAGVVADDSPSYMDQIMPIIDPPQTGFLASRLYLVITELEALTDV
ncbi:MAG TPA: hypothetical protein VIS06_09960 [Mycobacteriales bacterium]